MFKKASLAALLLLPLLVWLTGVGWSRLPLSFRNRWPAGAEVALYVLAVVAAIGASVALAPVFMDSSVTRSLERSSVVCEAPVSNLSASGMPELRALGVPLEGGGADPPLCLADERSHVTSDDVAGHGLPPPGPVVHDHVAPGPGVHVCKLVEPNVRPAPVTQHQPANRLRIAPQALIEDRAFGRGAPLDGSDEDEPEPPPS